MPALPRDFAIQQQHGDNLCWLAVAASLDAFHAGAAGGRDQCSLAQSLVAGIPLGTTCCPAAGTPPAVPAACDKMGRVSDAFLHIGHYGGESTALAPYADIENAVRADNPVALALEFSNGINHAVAVVDAYTEDNLPVLVIDDPADTSRIYYDYGAHDLGGALNIRWRRTFYTLP